MCCVSVCHQSGTIDQTYYQGRHYGENWGEERKAIFVQQGKEVRASHHYDTDKIISFCHQLKTLFLLMCDPRIVRCERSA